MFRTPIRRLSPLLLASVLASTPAHALFRVNYQGLDEEAKAAAAQRAFSEPEPEPVPSGPPAGFVPIADKTFEVVTQVGQGAAKRIEGFGLGVGLQEFMMAVLPDDWIAYIDGNITFQERIDWTANAGGTPWTALLHQMGTTYGLAFIVDWRQSMVQILPGQTVATDDRLVPIEVRHPVTKQRIYISTSKALADKGIAIINNKRYGVRLKKDSDD